MDLSLNNRQWFICHKTHPTNQEIEKKKSIFVKLTFLHLPAFWGVGRNAVDIDAG